MWEGWHVLEPTTDLAWNWHIEAVCDHLEAVDAGEIRRLLINMPPGHMKSLLVAVFWPAWVWLHRPSWRALFGSYAIDLAQRDSVRCRDLIVSPWYQETFRPEWELKGDQNVKTWFENTAGGLRMSLSVGGKGTGFRGDAVIFDDPLNVKEHPSDAELRTADYWWHKRMSSRLNNPRTGVKVGVMQRLHTKDLSGVIKAKGNYEHLILPSEFNPEKRCTTSIGWTDPRTERGELLFPELYGPEQLAEAREDLGEYGYAGQHCQEPVPEGGGILKRHWFGFWCPAGVSPPPPVRVDLEDGTTADCRQRELPAEFTRVITSWDMTFKNKKTSDLVAGQAWGQLDANMFMLDQDAGRKDFVQTLAAVIRLADRYPGANTHLIEDAANGPAVISTLREKIPALLPITPQGGKEARCYAASPTVEAGNVWLPHPALFPWVHELLHILTTFPYGEVDDPLDALTQAVNWLRAHARRKIRARRV